MYRGLIPRKDACGPHDVMAVHPRAECLTVCSAPTRICMQYGRTALMHAAEAGNADCVSALVQAKADLDLKNKVRW